MKKAWRLIRFGFIVLLITYLALNLGLSWVYVYVLTHPGCPVVPKPGMGLPLPEEYVLDVWDGTRIRAWYYPSENGAAVLALGGLQGALGGNLPPVDFLVARGYGVLQIDSRVCAEPPRAVTLGYAEVQDAEAGLAFLSTREEIDASRIGIMGFSMGGVTAIRTAAKHAEIAAVVAEGGYDNLGRDFVEPGQPKSVLHQIFLYSVAGMYWLQAGESPWRVSPIDDLARISPRAVLLIYGEHELDNGRGDRQYKAAKEPKELWVVPGGDHGRNYEVAREDYREKVLEFFDRYLEEH